MVARVSVSWEWRRLALCWDSPTSCRSRKCCKHKHQSAAVALWIQTQCTHVSGYSHQTLTTVFLLQFVSRESRNTRRKVNRRSNNTRLQYWPQRSWCPSWRPPLLLLWSPALCQGPLSPSTRGRGLCTSLEPSSSPLFLTKLPRHTCGKQREFICDVSVLPLLELQSCTELHLSHVCGSFNFQSNKMI